MRIKKVLPFFLLSFTLSQFSVQALEDNLTETINTYLQAKKNKPSEVVEYGYGSYITYPLGYGLRYAGDWLRSPSDTSTIIKGETSKHVASYVGSDNFQGKVVTQLTNNESIMESFWRGSGNGLRWLGACMVGEEVTLERKIRDFFMSDTTRNLRTSDILTITACALLQSNLEHVEDYKRHFDRFVTLINNGSFFYHENDPTKINESFIRGAIRYIVRHDKRNYLPNFNDDYLVNNDDTHTVKNLKNFYHFLKSLEIDPLNHLPATRDISPETLFEKERLREMNGNDIEAAVLEAKQKAAYQFIADIFSLEYAKVNHQHHLHHTTTSPDDKNSNH